MKRVNALHRPERLLSVAEMAVFSGVSAATIRKELVESPVLALAKRQRGARRWVVPVSAFNVWLGKERCGLPEAMLSATEIAGLTGLHKHTVLAAMRRERTLKRAVVSLCGAWRVPVSAFHAWVAEARLFPEAKNE